MSRIIKVLCLVIFIFFTRKIARENAKAIHTLNEIFLQIEPDVLFRFLAVNSMVVGIVIIATSFLFLGFEILRRKIFISILLFSIADSVLMYIYPEIPAAIFEAIYL